MTQALWRIGTDTAAYTAEDPTGAGAKAGGGRWNRKGSALVYASTFIALAALETIVHFNFGGLPLNRYLVRIDVPDDVWAEAGRLELEDCPVGWDAIPEGLVSLTIGEEWLAGGKSALLLVPSIIVPEEFNVLINPAHPDAAGLTYTKVRKFLYDPRLRTPTKKK